MPKAIGSSNRSKLDGIFNGSALPRKKIRLLNDLRARELAGKVLKQAYGLNSTRLEKCLFLKATGGARFRVDYDSNYQYDSEPFSKILRIGPLIFSPILVFPRHLEDVNREINRKTKALGETYNNNFGSIFFYTPSTYGFTNDLPLNPHAQDMIVQMLAQHNMFRSADRVVELGAGDGLHARIALALGVKQAVLIDNDQKELDRAEAYLRHDRCKKGKDYMLFNADLLDQARMLSLVRQHHLDEGVNIILINIGSYRKLYGAANEFALKLAMKCSPQLIINSGYRDIYEDGHGQDLKLMQELIRENGQYETEVISNGYPMGELYDKLTETITLILKPIKA